MNKKKVLKSNLDIVQFHKMRQLFPNKTSISTVQLQQIKPFAMENVGPGAYAKGDEQNNQAKKFGAALGPGFGSNQNRQLDTTEPGVIPNPGPGAYKTPPVLFNDKHNEQMSSVFKSIQMRKENYNGDLSFPAPTNYNLQDFNSISKKNLQGGAPNNVLALQKAEDKKVFDQIFPFLVQTRMPEDKKNLEMRDVGPGSYLTLDVRSSSSLQARVPNQKS